MRSEGPGSIGFRNPIRAGEISHPLESNAVARRDGIDFNLASIPSDFSDVSAEPFDHRYMNALFDRGYDLASRNYSWAKAPPGLEVAAGVHN